MPGSTLPRGFQFHTGSIKSPPIGTGAVLWSAGRDEDLHRLIIPYFLGLEGDFESSDSLVEGVYWGPTTIAGAIMRVLRGEERERLKEVADRKLFAAYCLAVCPVSVPHDPEENGVDLLVQKFA